MVFLFDKWHQVSVVVTRDHENALPAAFHWVRACQDVQQPTCLDCNDDALEGNSPLCLDGLVLPRAPAKWIHVGSLCRRVPFITTPNRRRCQDARRPGSPARPWLISCTPMPKSPAAARTVPPSAMASKAGRHGDGRSPEQPPQRGRTDPKKCESGGLPPAAQEKVRQERHKWPQRLALSGFSRHNACDGCAGASADNPLTGDISSGPINDLTKGTQ